MHRIKVKLNENDAKNVKMSLLHSELVAVVPGFVSAQYTEHKGKPHNLWVNVEGDIAFDDISKIRDSVRSVFRSHTPPPVRTIAERIATIESTDERLRFVEQVIASQFGDLTDGE